MTVELLPHKASDTKILEIQLDYLKTILSFGKTHAEIAILSQAAEQIRLTAMEQGYRAAMSYKEFLEANDGK